MIIAEELRPVFDALTKRGGRPFFVGGCVRDFLLDLEPKDFDIEVFGLKWDELEAVMTSFGSTNVVGRSFGVIKLRLGNCDYDISVPRRETKTGAGHRGFDVEPDPNIDERASTARRDFTVNALLFDPISGRVIDHHGGREDLQRHVLRHTSPAFVEDPLRVLRAFQFAARFNMTLDPDTAALCASIVSTYDELPKERVWGEWEKWAAKATVPSRGLAALKDSGWLACFPEIAALDGLPQEADWHPEGDVWTHTGLCLDALVGFPAWQASEPVGRQALCFAVLAHDFGKAETTQRAEKNGVERWTSPGHDQASISLTEKFLERIGSPIDLREHVRPLVANHHVHQSWPMDGPTPATVRRLARKLVPATIEELLLVLEADHRGRPPLISKATTERIARLREAAHSLALEAAAPRPILQGRDLIALGLTPGPVFSKILNVAFEAQLDGMFADHAAGLAWLRSHLGSESTPTGEGES